MVKRSIKQINRQCTYFIIADKLNKQKIEKNLPKTKN
jgi:hypothetical protein